jgi:phosphoglycolate phosphatase-like HAD superfamily hydrolase
MHHPEPLHLVLFDIDGTLIRGQGMGGRALARAFAEVLEVPDAASAYPRVTFNGRSDPAIIADLAVELGVEAGRLAARRRDLHESYLRHLVDTVAEAEGKQVLPGVRDAVETLAGLPGVRQGLLTGNVEEGARRKLDPFDLNRFFAFGGFGDDTHDRREIAARAHARGEEHAGTAVPPARVAVVGDTVHDVAAARAHGFLAVAVETGGVAGEALTEAGADVVFADLAADGGLVAWLTRRWSAAAASPDA